MPEAADRSIRTRVAETCVKNLAGNATVSDEFRTELRELFDDTKPPKAEAFASLFEKHSEGKPA